MRGGAAGAPVTVAVLELADISGAGAGAFSFPRPVAVAKAFKNALGSLAFGVAWGVLDPDGPATLVDDDDAVDDLPPGTYRTSFGDC